MDNKPDWAEAPKEAKILVRRFSGLWQFGTFHDARLEGRSWVGLGSGQWISTGKQSAFGGKPLIEYRPERDLKYDQGNPRLDLASTKQSEVINIKGNGMKELNNEIKLTLNLMQGDIDDGAHGELQNHLYSLLEIKRNEIQKCLAETA